MKLAVEPISKIHRAKTLLFIEFFTLTQCKVIPAYVTMKHHKLAFSKMIERMKKLTTIVLGRKNLPRPFFRRKELSKNAEM